MPRATNSDIAVFDIDQGSGAASYLAWLKSSNFNWEFALEVCAGIATRHRARVETKRTLTFDATMNRKSTSGAACQTPKQVVTLSFDGDSYLASWQSVDFSYTNANSRSDAASDALAQVQLHAPTDISGTIEIMVDQATATRFTDFIDAGESVDATFSFTDGVGTITCATHFKSIRKTWPESGLVMLSIGFEGGTVSSGGGGFFALGLTGTGQFDFSASEGADPIEGTAVILSGNLKVNRDQKTEESYSCHVNSVAVPA